jgi:hypothetical protein
MAADFGAGFLPVLGEHGRHFPQQDLGFFTEETIPQTPQTEKSIGTPEGLINIFHVPHTYS